MSARLNPALATLDTGRGAVVLRSSTPSGSLHDASGTPGRSRTSSSGFSGADKIDYVLVQPGTEVMSAEIVR